jgi:hypothetical protein
MSQYCVAAIKKDRAILCSLRLVLEHLGASEPAIITLKEYLSLDVNLEPTPKGVIHRATRLEHTSPGIGKRKHDIRA